MRRQRIPLSTRFLALKFVHRIHRWIVLKYLPFDTEEELAQALFDLKYKK